MTDRQEHLVIAGLASLSALGGGGELVWSSWGEFLAAKPSYDELAGWPVFRIPGRFEAELAEIQSSFKGLPLDRATQLGIWASRQAVTEAGWSELPPDRLAVLLGTARGAAATYEERLADFLSGRELPTSCSPTTTLGVFSSAVQRDLSHSFGWSNELLPIDLSMTCSSGMLAIIMAISLLKSGAVTAAVAGGAEAPLTNFTIAQMTRLGIYSNYFNGDCSGNEGENYPCRPLGSNPSSTFCLGEGAGVVALQCSATPQPGTPLILGWGTASEVAETATGITPSGSAFRRAIEAALNRYRSDYPELEGRISLIIPHAPGTRRGDQAELVALQSCFGASLPPLVSGKWLTGHTFGASGLLAIDLASRLSRLDFAGWDKESKSGRRGEGLKESLSYFPYPVLFEQEGYLNCIEPCSELCGTNFVTLINSNGFGGVACSLIIGW